MSKEPVRDVLPGPSAYRSKPKRSTSLLAFVAALATFTFTSLYFNFAVLDLGSLLNSPRGSRFNHAPFHAKEILDKCAALKVPAGPPKDFHLRTASDRHTPGTPSTIIYNARIWTGERNGTEVMDGFVWLKKGIVVAIGGLKEQKEVLKELRSSEGLGFPVKFVNAGWKWVTPGLGKSSAVDIRVFRKADRNSSDQSTCTHTLGFLAAQYLMVCEFAKQWSPSHGWTFRAIGSMSINSRNGPIIPWLRSIDGFNTHDDFFELAISGGVTSAQILPGSGNAQGGQAFMVKLRKTPERSPSSMIIDPPHSLNGSTLDPSLPPRWRHMK